MYIGYSASLVSHTSWGAVLTDDYHERSRIFGTWQAMNILGLFLILGVPPLALWLAGTEDPALGVHAMGWVIMTALPLAVLLAVSVVPERARVGTGHHKLSDIFGLLKLPLLRQLLAADLLAALAPGLTGALFLFFFEAARGYPPAEASALLLFYFAAGLLAAPLWVRFARRRGKHRALVWALILYMVFQTAILLMPAGNFPLAAVRHGAGRSAGGGAGLPDAGHARRCVRPRDAAHRRGANRAVLCGARCRAEAWLCHSGGAQLPDPRADRLCAKARRGQRRPRRSSACNGCSSCRRWCSPAWRCWSSANGRSMPPARRKPPPRWSAGRRRRRARLGTPRIGGRCISVHEMEMAMIGKMTLATLVCLPLLAACTTDQYGNQRMSSAGTGALIGAAGGATVGALTGGNVAAGAAIGAGAGAIVGIVADDKNRYEDRGGRRYYYDSDGRQYYYDNNNRRRYVNR